MSAPHAASPDAKLVTMANQIATFFASQPREDAVAGIENHIRKFCEGRINVTKFAFDPQLLLHFDLRVEDVMCIVEVKLVLEQVCFALLLIPDKHRIRLPLQVCFRQKPGRCAM